MNSRMSLAKTSDEEGGAENEDDDDFGDTISLLEGKDPGAPTGRRLKSGGDCSQLCNDNSMHQ